MNKTSINRIYLPGYGKFLGLGLVLHRILTGLNMIQYTPFFKIKAYIREMKRSLESFESTSSADQGNRIILDGFDNSSINIH